MRKILKYAVMSAMVLTVFGLFCFICCMEDHVDFSYILAALVALLAVSTALNIMSAVLNFLMTEKERKELE